MPENLPNNAMIAFFIKKETSLLIRIEHDFILYITHITLYI